MSNNIIKAPGTRKPPVQKINTLFNHKLFESLAWRMQHAQRFSTDEHEIKGTDIQVWDIVIGDYNEYAQHEFAIVIATCKTRNDCDNLQLMRLCQCYSLPPGFIQVANEGSIYFTRNNSYRTISEYELGDFWEALEAIHEKSS